MQNIQSLFTNKYSKPFKAGRIGSWNNNGFQYVKLLKQSATAWILQLHSKYRIKWPKMIYQNENKRTNSPKDEKKNVITLNP